MVEKIAFDIAAGVFGETVTVEYEGSSFETTAVWESPVGEDESNVSSHTAVVWMPEGFDVGYGALLKRANGEVWQVFDVVKVSGLLKVRAKSHVRPHP